MVWISFMVTSWKSKDFFFIIKFCLFYAMTYYNHRILRWVCCAMLYKSYVDPETLQQHRIIKCLDVYIGVGGNCFIQLRAHLAACKLNKCFDNVASW